MDCEEMDWDEMDCEKMGGEERDRPHVGKLDMTREESEGRRVWWVPSLALIGFP